MATVEIQYDASTPASLAGSVVATTATLAVVAPNGTTLAAPTVTKPATATTIAAGTTATVLTLADVTGISPGTALLVTSDGVAYDCTAAVVDTVARTVALVIGLPVIPDTGAAVATVTMTATVAAPGSANIGPNWRLVWTYDDGGDDIVASQPAAVVRQRWLSPIGAGDVRAILAEMNTARSEQWCADLAAMVDAEIRGKVEATGRRPWAYLSPMAFVSAARQGIRYELSRRGIAHGAQIYEAQRELRFAFDDSLSSVIGALAYDKDADGAISGAEGRPMFSTIQAVR